MNYNDSIQDGADFPKHDVDPREKIKKKWMLQAARAIWSNWTSGMPVGSSFYAKRQRCSEIRDYALNEQSTAQYLKWQTGEDDPDDSFLNIDQSTDALVKTHRQKLLGRVKKTQYNIMATPLDATAKGKLDEYFDEARVKILMQQAAQQVSPEMAQNPLLAIKEGDAQDLEELEMEIEFSPKFIRARDAEKGISMVFYENNFEELIDLIDEDITDFGAGIIRDGIDENNRVFLEFVPYASFICSKAENKFFNNLSFAGHVSEVALSTLASYFDGEDFKKIEQHCRGKNGNPSTWGAPSDGTYGYDAFKALVLNFEYKSYDMVVTSESKNKAGNLKFNVADPSVMQKDDKDESRQTEGVKHDGKNYENIYEGKYIIGTDFIYAYKKSTNTKRSMDDKKLTKTDVSYHVVASSFDKMRTKGITEDIIPIADEIQMTVLKLRNLNNTMILNGLAIDFSALENVALGGSGGKSLTPEENLQMLFQKGIVGYRSDEILADGKNQRKPVESLVIDYAGQFTSLWMNYSNNVNKLYDVTGLNQSTDSATVDPKLLVGVVNAQNQGTNNALHFILSARRYLVQMAARSSVQRLQAALLLGPYEGYVQTLGRQTVSFIQFEEKMLPYDCDIIIEDRPTDEQKQIVYQMMQEDIKKGLLNSGDVFAVMNNHNLKDAQVILNHRSRKAQKKIEEAAMQREQMNGKIQQEAAMNAEKAKQETAILASKLKKEEITLAKEWDYKIAQLTADTSNMGTQANNLTKLAQTAMSQQPQPMEAGANDVL